MAGRQALQVRRRLPHADAPRARAPRACYPRVAVYPPRERVRCLCVRPPKVLARGVRTCAAALSTADGAQRLHRRMTLVLPCTR